MSAGTLISLDEYLRTSYSPDREYRDGVLVERNVGKKAHARMQALLAAYAQKREKVWGIQVYTELRIRIRHDWYPIPDVCLYAHEFEDEIPSEPPLLWIEILSETDSMSEVWSKAKELIAGGVPYIWIIEPKTLESELWTAQGKVDLPDKTLRIPNSPIVIPLPEVVQD